MLQLPAELVQAVHDYLMTRPMAEVERLVLAVRQATPVPVALPAAQERTEGQA